MPATESLKIELPVEMAAILREAVASGEFTSNDELIGEAIREWKLNHQENSAKDFGDLRRIWQDALDAGADDSKYLELDEVFAPLLEKYSRKH
jgi:Arc/MetJ-type ribon-helix-helix transcriptional regulator